MRVYVESNFVLELVLQQEQFDACARIVARAAAGRASLVVPAFALVEPYETLTRHTRERQRVTAEASIHLDQIGRASALSARAASVSGLLAELLVRSTQAASRRLNDQIAEMTEVAEILPLAKETFTKAAEMSALFGLELPDALVLASIVGDPELGKGSSCFLSRNTKDFGDPSVVELLRAKHCKFLGNFEHGLAFIEAASDSA